MEAMRSTGMANNIPIWTSKEAGRIVTFIAWASAAGLILTLILAVVAWHNSCRVLIVGLAAFWAISPPLYFWYEYHFVYLKFEPNMDYFDRFKYGQQVSIAIWAGVAVTLGALAASDHFG